MVGKEEWTVSLMMTSDGDLIRRSDAIAALQAEMKRTYTPARKGGFKGAISLVQKVPSVTVRSPGSSHWFYNAGWFFCDNCGGKAAGCGYTPYCQHCGSKMDDMPEIE